MNRVLTRDQVRRIDEIAVERYGIPSLILMENAGRNAAAVVDSAYGPDARAFIACGPGNNGGGGCVIARHLHNAHWSVRLMMTAPHHRWTGDTGVNYRIVEAMGLQPFIADDRQAQHDAVQSIGADDVVIDALLGTGFQGQVRCPLDALIHALNGVPKRAVVAVDVPSGLDCDTGRADPATVRADLTVTFVAQKLGFTMPHATPFLGRVQVADIGVPRDLIEQVTAM